MRRGEIWTVAGGRDDAGKPRPVVILQDDRFDATDSITICAFTTDPTDAPLFRVLIQPSAKNGLRAPRRLVVDQITTVPKSKAGSRIGRLDDEDILRLLDHDPPQLLAERFGTDAEQLTVAAGITVLAHR
ncbi:MAG TPA: type II toxin-antitoxin system PemK/MazF family toxin [Geminicoccaceae bacterium]